MGRQILGILSLLVLSACGSGSGVKSNEPASVFIYADYKISAEEESDSVTVLLQFRDESVEEQNIRFAKENQVMLDGKPLQAGQTKILGTYYEMRLPLEGFSGKHEILFTDRRGKKHPDYFLFETLSLAEPLPDTISAPELELRFAPVNTERPIVRLVLNDTSFIGEGINRTVRLKNNQVLLDTADLAVLHEGPVMLQCYLETETETNDPDMAGGLITVSYSFRRQFILRRNSPAKSQPAAKN